MPSPQEILQGLAFVAGTYAWVAIAWHIALAAALVAVAFAGRPSARIAGVAITLPLWSAGLLALVYQTPSGVVLVATALTLTVLGARLPATTLEAPSVWVSAAGVGMVAVGWFYPHFLEGSSLLAYAYGAPLGVVPCASLSAAIGLALLGGGLHTRAWSLVLASVGLLYGLFGVFYLGVSLDWLLLAGSVVLLIEGITAMAAGGSSRLGHA